MYRGMGGWCACTGGWVGGVHVQGDGWVVSMYRGMGG